MPAKHAENDTYTATETRCETIYEEHSKLLGYDVEYRLGEKPGRLEWIINRAKPSPFKMAL